MGTHPAAEARAQRRQSELGLRVLVIDDERETVTTAKSTRDNEGDAAEDLLTHEEVPP
jgi:hypothetical protein